MLKKSKQKPNWGGISRFSRISAATARHADSPFGHRDLRRRRLHHFSKNLRRNINIFSCVLPHSGGVGITEAIFAQKQISLLPIRNAGAPAKKFSMLKFTKNKYAGIRCGIGCFLALMNYSMKEKRLPDSCIELLNAAYAIRGKYGHETKERVRAFLIIPTLAGGIATIVLILKSCVDIFSNKIGKMTYAPILAAPLTYVLGYLAFRIDSAWESAERRVHEDGIRKSKKKSEVERSISSGNFRYAA